ncbi:hypothetical protein [Streptomyces sp. TS71-3]|uniref:hypothetical protein n=1 Tax=Streptomyces sp. TS71-3 TaxID=2733862 RepID=UPI001AFF3037|nr:hypothetical protein [Streptomyces sp. TS71-3]GHJ41187.1 hypothetical protein Sm713_67960 [Streptomyces sp. TS71-3]
MPTQGLRPERAGDNLGAVVGPLPAAQLVSLSGIREALYFAALPGLLAAIAITVAGREARRTLAAPAARRRIRLNLKELKRAGLARALLPVAMFEVGNIAVTLLILRAIQLLHHGSRDLRPLEVRWPTCRCAQTDRPGVAEAAADRAPGQRQLGESAGADAAGLGSSRLGRAFAMPSEASNATSAARSSTPQRKEAIEQGRVPAGGLTRRGSLEAVPQLLEDRAAKRMGD